MGVGVGYAIFGLSYQNNSFSDMMQENKDDYVNVIEKIRFNPNIPITIPLVDGYYDGKRVYFIHTEVSDPQMAGMMTSMVNFPTLYIPDLKDITEKPAKVYVFTNGVPGTGPYGGGPFMFQIDIFDSIPGKNGYSQFRVPHLVTWNKDSIPRVLISEKELLDAQRKGELVIESTNKIVNAPMIVWMENDDKVTAKKIEKIFTSMGDVTAEIVRADIDLYTVTMNLHSEKTQMMMN